MDKVSRRKFLKGLAVVGGSVLLGGAHFVYRRLVQLRADSLAEMTPEAYMPVVSKAEGTAVPSPRPNPTSTPTAVPSETPTLTDPGETPEATPTETVEATPEDTPVPPPPGTARVVHMLHPDATDWDFGDAWYGNHVNQTAVDAMTARGLMLLTGTTSVAAAWQALLPNYRSGERVAIKINLNNCLDDSCQSNAIDAVIEPVNALIGGLLGRGVAASDIVVFDVTHAWHDGRMPAFLVNGCDYPGVRFAGYVGEANPFSTEMIRFNTPAGGPAVPDLPICRVLVEATYLINMPIVKSHPFTGVTLGFKNHFGSFDRCDYAHIYTPGCPPEAHDNCVYYPEYSPLIDIFANRHIGGKTILTVGDCLFGAWSNPAWRPLPWRTFGNGAPNSLFFGVDSLAIECVMTDILAAETNLQPDPDQYLRLAGQAGLGVYERGDPWGAGYRQIEYVREGSF